VHRGRPGRLAPGGDPRAGRGAGLHLAGLLRDLVPQPAHGALEGIEIDLARALAERLGVQLHFVETDFVGFVSRLRGGDCDVATMAVAITPERAARVALTRPHLASPVYARDDARQRAGAPLADIDRPGNVVAVGAGTFIEGLMAGSLRHAELLVVRPPATREAELLAGRADVFMTDYPYSRRVAAMQDWAVVIAPPDRFGETPYAWAAPLTSRNGWRTGRLPPAARQTGAARAAARHGSRRSWARRRSGTGLGGPERGKARSRVQTKKRPPAGPEGVFHRRARGLSVMRPGGSPGASSSATAVPAVARAVNRDRNADRAKRAMRPDHLLQLCGPAIWGRPRFGRKPFSAAAR
jgi:ABC-type amino acid transport substrate-binding protein